MTVETPYRVHQTSTTSGVGSYALISATAQFQNFRGFYATGATVQYLATDNTSGFELTIGVLTTGATDTLSRSTVVLSSSGNAAVNWSGATLQIFAAWPASAEPSITFSGNNVADLTDWSNVKIYNGTGGNTLTLPAASTAPNGYSMFACNAGTGSLMIAPNGSDTINGLSSFAIPPGAMLKLIPNGNGWQTDYRFPTTWPSIYASYGQALA